MGWSSAIGWSYASKLDPAPTMAKYYNDTGSKKIIKDFYMYLGTGNASYTAGDALTGDGSTIEFYVSINGVESSHVDVTNDIGRAGSAEDGYYPPVADTIKYTVQFTNGVEVPAGGEVSVIGAYNADIIYPGQVLVARKGDAYVGGTVVSGSTYTISYDANGGTGAPASQTKQSGQTLTLSTTKPTKSSTTVSQYTVTYNRNYSGSTDGSATARKTRSYSFSKWNTKSDGSGTSYNSGGSYTADANATLYAQYSSSDSGGSVTLPSYTRSGYTLEGWYTAASGGTKVGNSGASYTPTSNITLYAHWVANEYTITFDANGGSGAPSSQTKTRGVDLTLTSNKPTTAKSYTVTYDKNGGTLSQTSKQVLCTFKEWNTSRDGSGTAYNPGDTYSVDATITLYAQWSDSKVGTMGQPERSNCIFVGWYTAKYNGTIVDENTIIHNNITIYAIWDYKIIYDANGGDADTVPNTQIKKHNTDIWLSSGYPENDGKEFKGWATSPDSSVVEYRPNTEYEADAPLILYAIWELTKHIVTFDLRGGNYTGSIRLVQEVEHGGSAEVPSPNPTKASKQFQGWYGNYTNVTSDRTIIALWDTCPVWIYTENGWIRLYN